MAKADSVLDTLKQAVKGLVFVSESDADLEAFQWSAGEPTADNVKKLSGQKYGKDVAVEETTVEGFFRAVPSGSKKKFTQLAQTLKDNLDGVKVYKIGDEAEKDVYIVGKAKDGTLAGVKTQVVET